jgi:hypothetical protein
MRRWAIRFGVVLAIGGVSAAGLRWRGHDDASVLAYVTQAVPGADDALAFQGNGFTRRPTQSTFTAAAAPDQPTAIAAKAPERVAGNFEVGRGKPWKPVRFSLPHAGPVVGRNESGAIAYREAYSGVDVVVVRDPEHVELGYVVRDPAARPDLRLRFAEGEQPAYDPRLERVEVRSPEGEVRLAIAKPRAFDAKGVQRSGTYRIEGRDVVLNLDLAGLEAPVFVDPLLYIPAWTLVDDARQPSSSVYQLDRISTEAKLLYDGERRVPISLRPIRAQQPEDDTAHFGSLWQYDLPSVQAEPRGGGLLGPHLTRPELDEWTRTYGAQSEVWEMRQGRWQLAADTGLPGLIDPAIAFDAKRGRLVAYGGGVPAFSARQFAWGAAPAQVFPSITYPWDATYERVGSQWQAKRVLDSPPPRLRAGMSGFGDGVVLFGGRALELDRMHLVYPDSGKPAPDNITGGLLADTWTYDGTSWRQVETSSAPPAQEAAQLIRDTRRNRLVLVPGSTGSELEVLYGAFTNLGRTVPRDDFSLWEFDGADWIQRFAVNDPALPPELRRRRGVAAVWHPVRKTVLLFGGYMKQQPTCTLPLSYHRQATANPTLMAQIEAEGCVAGWVHDFWEWDGEVLRQLSRSAFAGYSGNFAIYRQVAGSVPAPVLTPPDANPSRPSKLWPWRYDQRADHFHLHTALERAYVAPGSAAVAPPVVTATGESLPPAPPGAPTFVSPAFFPGVRPELVFDPATSDIIVTSPGESRSFRTSIATWEEPSASSPFSDGANDFFAGAWDTFANRVLLFDPRTGKTWQHRDAGWSQLPVTADLAAWTVPSELRKKRDMESVPDGDLARTGPKLPRMVFDRERRVAVLWHDDALWELRDGAWLSKPLPDGLKQCNAALLMAYDGARGRTVAVGCKLPGLTWEWDGANWYGPFATPYTALAERTWGVFGLSTWSGPLQLAYAHPNALGELPSLGGVGTVDYDGTLRVWNGSAWTDGPKLAEGSMSDAGAFILESPTTHGVPSNYSFLNEYAVPLAVYPPLVEDGPSRRVLAFRDGITGLREIDLRAAPEARSWTETLVGRRGIWTPDDDPHYVPPHFVHPHPLELWSPEQVREGVLCDPAQRGGADKELQALFWPFRLFTDPAKKRTLVLTHRGALWQLGSEPVGGVGDPCTTVADCGTGIACVRGQCSAGDYGNPCDSDDECAHGAACIDGVCCNNRSCVLACNTCNGSNPGYCEALPAGTPDVKLRHDKNGLRCDGQQCGGVCPGGTVLSDNYLMSAYLQQYLDRPACVFPSGPRSCGPSQACQNGRYQPPGSCLPNSTTCQLAAPVACEHGCADDTRCRLPSDPGCSTRADCTAFETCDTATQRCVPDAVSLAATQAGVQPATWSPPIRRNPQQVADLLRDAGFPEDDAGRIRFDEFSPGGILLAFDPNLKTPVMGHRSCFARINSCVSATKTFDGCFAAAPRCVTATPWLDDPAGFDCCPEACLLAYFEARSTQDVGQAAMSVVQGMCYPGLESQLEGIQ